MKTHKEVRNNIIINSCQASGFQRTWTGLLTPEAFFFEEFLGMIGFRSFTPAHWIAPRPTGVYCRDAEPSISALPEWKTQFLDEGLSPPDLSVYSNVDLCYYSLCIYLLLFYNYFIIFDYLHYRAYSSMLLISTWCCHFYACKYTDNKDILCYG